MVILYSCKSFKCSVKKSKTGNFYGVVDFVNKVFREGYPEDYITKTTKINYIPYNENDADFMKTSQEIEIFMNKLFPIPDLNRYMRDHLASCLIGAKALSIISDNSIESPFFSVDFISVRSLALMVSSLLLYKDRRVLVCASSVLAVCL